MTNPDKQSIVIASLSPGEAALMEYGMNGDDLNQHSSQREPELLNASEDMYDGMIVELDNLHLDAAGFVSSLKASLSKWAQQGKKGVWIKVLKENSNLVPALIQEGFWYHHAERTYVMLVYWIPESPCTLPANASHQVGVCAFVMNDKREVLAVQEKNGPYRGSGIWKMPTGLLEQGEDIFTGVRREVKEETGIDAEFLEVVGMRFTAYITKVSPWQLISFGQGTKHFHNAPFDKSDINLVCILRPLSFDIETQETEIAAAKWMPIEEFMAQPKYQESELYKKLLEVCIAGFEKRYEGFSAVPITPSSAEPQPVFYCNVQDMNRASNDIIS